MSNDATWPVTEKNAVYRERNQLVALLARLYPSGIRRTEIEGWDPEWHGCVYVDTPAGQLSWHYHDDDADMFAGLPPYAGEWDGHSTDLKYERVAALRNSCEAADSSVRRVVDAAENVVIAYSMGWDLHGTMTILSDLLQGHSSKPADHLDSPLPCDIRVGSVVFSRGVPLRTFVEAASRWNAKAAKLLPAGDPEAMATLRARLTAAAGG